MKLDKRVIRVAVLPMDVESICNTCIYRNIVDCCGDIYDIDRPLRPDSPIITCFETARRRIVTNCGKKVEESFNKIQNGRTSFDYARICGHDGRILVKKNPKKYNKNS